MILFSRVQIRPAVAFRPLWVAPAVGFRQPWGSASRGVGFEIMEDWDRVVQRSNERCQFFY